jgi:DNA-directed RNA polymerase specialized sigma24 family protein
MRYQWDWASFFRKEIQPPLTLDHNYQDLLSLPFMQGLQVIVTSVPPLAHDQWVIFHNCLTDCHHQHADYWLLISRLIRDHVDDMRHILHEHVERAAERLQRLLREREPVEQFALVACLYHFAQTSLKARLLLTNLLQHGESDAAHLDAVLRFYNGLTKRQKDVALLAAHGLTNQEIADYLCIEPKVVAEHLTTIFARFQQAIQYQPDRHGTRYRLIHWLTRLLEKHPHLHLERDL